VLHISKTQAINTHLNLRGTNTHKKIYLTANSKILGYVSNRFLIDFAFNVMQMTMSK